MTTIERTQRHIAQLLVTVEADLDQRLLMIDRAASLLASIKRAKLHRRLCEQTTPPDFFDSTWAKQMNALRTCELRLQRIISGADAPQQPCRTHL